MDVPADRSRPTSAPPLHPTLREAARSSTSAAVHRGGPAAALSAPDQWHRLAGGRAGPLAAGRKPADGPAAHHDLALASVMVDKQGQVWLVDSDRAEAAASDRLLDRDVATLLAALGRVADPALVRATAGRALRQEVLQRAAPPRPGMPAPLPAPALEEGAKLD
jgi:hypothetical protein